MFASVQHLLEFQVVVQTFMFSARQHAFLLFLLVSCGALVAVATDDASSANCRSVESLHVLKLLCELLHLAGPGLGGETAFERSRFIA